MARTEGNQHGRKKKIWQREEAKGRDVSDKRDGGGRKGTSDERKAKMKEDRVRCRRK